MASNQFRLAVGAGAAAAKLKMFVEEQVSRSLAVLHRQRGESMIFCMKLHHAAEIDRADDVYVVKKEWHVQPAGIAAAGSTAAGVFEEKPGGFFQAAAGFEQDL